MESEDIDLFSYDNVKGSEAYPKKLIQTDDPAVTVPFPTLTGEGIEYLGYTTEGTIALSNYRIFVHTKESIFNIPIGLIEQVEIRDIFFLIVFCKDARSLRCTFGTNEDCQKWCRRLLNTISPPKKVADLFGFAFFLWCRDERQDSIFQLLHQDAYFTRTPRDQCTVFQEAKRMGFDQDTVWKISDINKDYKLCPSYPRYMLVPATISDKDLEAVASFRYSRRIPTVIWRHRVNGAVIARSSQPEVGWLGWRSNQDEKLLQAIIDACICDPGSAHDTADPNPCDTSKSTGEGDCEEISLLPQLINGHASQGTSNRKLLIVDARSYAAAVANRAKGGGCECPEYYSNCEIQFMSLANIHSIRKSFHSLRVLCASPPDQVNWLSVLESTRWLHYVGGLLRSAMIVVNAVDIEKRPVLVHCSDGWDRTPQIVALAEVMLDPYYRTMQGFRVLVEREWLDFGHKFSDRCGNGPGLEDPNERCPVFLQWLDCIHQLLHQFPCSFEFNKQYLVKLAHHTFSCLFGTFLCNSSQERDQEHVRERTFSVWAYLASRPEIFYNYLFVHSEQVLRPSCQIRDMVLWADVYLPPAVMPSVCNEDAGSAGDFSTSDTNQLVKTKSCDNIFQLGHHPERQRRSSDPAIGVGDIGDLGPEQLRSGDNTLVLTLNVDINCDAAGRICTSPSAEVHCEDHSSCQSAPEVTNPSIDGSTDTLVSENGTVPSDSSRTSIQSETIENSSTECMNVNRSRETLGNCKMLPDLSPNMLSASTSTTDISGSCIYESDSVSSCWLAKTTPWTDLLNTHNLDMKEARNVPGERRIRNLWDEDSPLSCGKSSISCSSAGGYSSRYSTPQHSRTPSSGFPPTPSDDRVYEATTSRGHVILADSLDYDGLLITQDRMQQRLQQIITAHQMEVENLHRKLKSLKKMLSCHHCCCQKNGHGHDCCEEEGSLSDSACSGEHQSIGQESMSSDLSWEHVDDRDAQATLWVPDHAASQCMSCDADFGLVLRRHHCRCGKVFCYQCCSQVLPVPSEQLYSPVRVCQQCFEGLRSRCRQQLMSCEKLPKHVVTAAST
ncbi:phosphatidylinositol-3,5-bisphosphate 3-phosphatase MTMR3 isoform X2 [Tachypleus tridentatus]|uniref:phosphatidylinositol-3,5-bisphosphate 3-phosphatase MTMR3 isoform X2 n=1 Tax=Tachypleus tridentatus TaxID=6853 RepID=UPI003FD45A83